MLRLNLVSEKLKKEIELRHIYDMIKRIIIIFLIFTIFISIILSVANYTLETYFDSIIKTEKNFLNGRYNEEVGLINKKINAVEEIQDSHFSPYFIIQNVLSYSNESINIKTIKIAVDEEKMYISGLADTRDNLIVFKTNLESFDFFAEISMPTVNIFKKDDISFNIEAIINE